MMVPFRVWYESLERNEKDMSRRIFHGIIEFYKVKAFHGKVFQESKVFSKRFGYKAGYKLCSMAVMAGLLACSLTACGGASDVVNGSADSVSGAFGNSHMDEDDSMDNAMGDTGNGDGIGSNTFQGQQTNAMAVNASAVNLITVEEMFTDRDLRGDYTEAECEKIILSGNSAQCSSKAVQISGSTVTILKEGVYLLSGTLQEGMIVIAADDTEKVQLVFDNASISNSANVAIYAKSADKVFITLAAGTTNTLENGGSYTVLDDNKIDGVIFAKCDLTINGMGSLKITAAEGHGIVSKDDVRIASGNLTITAAGHGISGKDSVRIADGTLSITSGKDGIQSSHDTNEEKGYVYIKDGEFTITADGDGISASKTLQIDGGSFVIVTGGGSSNRTVAKDENGDTVSAKGIKASGAAVVNGGSFLIDSQDDAFHSNADLMIHGGEYQIATGDDGFHADETITIAGGAIDITASYEGIEGNDVVISGGNIKLYASDDGVNAAGGNDQSGFGGPFGRDHFGGGSDSSLLISGGTIYINADGDGVDSNGSLTVSGGEVYISGPSNSANGALDYEGVGQITGGIVVAVGSSGMAMNFGDASTQGSILMNVSNQTAGTEIVVRDAAGEELIAYTAESVFNSIVVSSPKMVQGGTYTILVGDNEQSITLESLIYGSGMGGFGPGRGNGWGGRDGRGTPDAQGGPGSRGNQDAQGDPGNWGKTDGQGGPGSWGSPDAQGSSGNWGNKDVQGNRGDWEEQDGQGGQGGMGREIPDDKGQRPEGNQPPEMGQMPEGNQPPEMGQVPEGNQPPR